ncbi:MAG: hypothetical protein IJP00_05795 [Firmicutes bacterium]|nr:hypothetical protein [Bacillota bacterium]
MVMRIMVAALFGVLFYFGAFLLPQSIGFSKAKQKSLDFIGRGDITEFGKVDTLLVPDSVVIDEKGELEKEAVEIVTMIGQNNVQTVLMTEKDKNTGDEMARRLGAVKTYCGTSDYMSVIKELEAEGKNVLYAEGLWDAEAAVELGKTVKSAIKTNIIWTLICGIGGVITASNIGVVISVALQLAVLTYTSLKIKKE